MAPMRLSALTFLFLVCGCQAFNNRFNTRQHACQISEWSPYENKVLFRLRSPDGEGVEPSSVARLSFLRRGAPPESISLSKAGCFALPEKVKGRIEAAIPANEWGLAVDVDTSIPSNKIRDLPFSRITPLSIELPCPEKRVVGDVRQLWIPFRVSSGTPSPGTRFLLDASVGENHLFLDGSSQSETNDLPDGLYSIQARAVDILGRSTTSQNCILQLDSRVPAPPQPTRQLVARDDGSLEFSAPAAFRSFACFESDAEPVGKCLLDASFSPFDKLLKAPGAGFWRLYTYSESEAGLRSRIESFRVAGDWAAPQLSLAWKNTEQRGGVSIVPRPEMNLEVEVTVGDDISTTDSLLSKLECRVEFSPKLGVSDRSPDAVCTAPSCLGQTLDAFRPCSREFSFSVRNEKEHLDEQIRVVARLSDESGRGTEKHLSTWMLKGVIEKVVKRLDVTVNRILPLPDEPSAVVIAGESGLYFLGSKRAAFPDGPWGSTAGRTVSNAIITHKNELWYAEGWLRVHRIPIDDPTSAQSWKVEGGNQCSEPQWMAMDGSSSMIAACRNNKIFHYLPENDTWQRYSELESAIIGYHFSVTDDGELWLLGENRLHLWEQGQLTRPIDLPDGFSQEKLIQFKMQPSPQGLVIWLFKRHMVEAFLVHRTMLRPLPECTLFAAGVAFDADASGRAVLQGHEGKIYTFENSQWQMENLELARETTSRIEGTYSLRLTSGGVWFGTSSEVYSLTQSPASLTFSTHHLGLSTGDNVKAMVNHGKSVILLTYSGALRRFLNDDWIVIPTPPFPLYAIWSDGETHLLAVSESGIVYSTSDREEWVWKSLGPVDPQWDLSLTNCSRCRFSRNARGETLLHRDIDVNSGNTYRINNNGTIENISHRYQIGNLHSDTLGRTWGEQEGKTCVFHEEQGTWQCFEGLEFSQYDSHQIPRVVANSNGTTWAVDYNAQLYQLDGLRWIQSISQPSFGILAADRRFVWAAETAQDGSLWLGVSGLILHGRIKNNGWQWTEVSTGISMPWRLDLIFCDAQGRSWVGGTYDTGPALSLVEPRS